MLPNDNNNSQSHGQSQSMNFSTSAMMMKNNATYLRILDMLKVFLSKWYLFVICIAITLSVCYAYLLVTPPVYKRSASILIKNDTKSGQNNGGMSFLNSNIDVNNELFTLQSPSIAEEVVRTLNLDMNYYAQGRFHEECIYGTSLGIEIVSEDLTDLDYANFMFVLNSDETFEMSDFTFNGLSAGGDIKGKLGQTLKTPIGKLKVVKTPNYFKQNLHLRVTRIPIKDAVNRVSSSLSVSSVSDMSTVINVVYMDVNPQRAEDILATVISVYENNWMKDRNRMSVSTSEFIADRLKIIEEELGNVETDISSFKSANLIPASQNDVASIYVGQATNASAQQTQINQQLYMARYVRNYLTDESKRFQLIPGSGQSVNNAGLSGQISEYNSLLLSRNNLLNASSLQNPLVQERDAILNDLRVTLVSSVDNYIIQLNSELASAQSVEGKANSKIASSPTQSKYLLSVERQQKVKESLYLYLLQKREENELSQAFTAYNSRTINPPSGSNAPTFPNRQQVWLIGLLVGLVVPGVIIFLLEAINNKVRGRRDLAELTIPFVGEIPLHRHHRTIKEKLFGPIIKFANNFKDFIHSDKKHKEDKTLHILVKDRSRNVINEAFRVIRTNIEFMTAKGDNGKIIMLTSFNPNSGKTFVASNLITSFAIKKKKVLAIDLDLRKASLSAMVDKPKKGISDYLSGVVDDINEVIVKGQTHENLDVIPVGTVPPNPTELLFDDRLANLLQDLRDKYEYIFLDCPPVEIVADASIVGHHADATLFLIRAELLDRSLLPEIQRYYDDNKLPKMTIILNGTTDAFSYYGYHRYGSRYGYYGASYYGGYTHEKE